jgi:hypothetical protein
VEVEVLRQRFLDIKTTDRFAIFFFAGETSGELGRETPRLYEDACKNSQGGPMGFTIMRIALYLLSLFLLILCLPFHPFHRLALSY